MGQKPDAAQSTNSRPSHETNWGAALVRPYLPLTALRAFEASARHLSFTRAAIELCVTQGAVSHQVKALERTLGATLFERLPRGLMLTREGEMLLPGVRDAFDRIAGTLTRFEKGQMRETLRIGAVGTFAVGWLLPRLPDFAERHPFVDLRLSTHNNRVDPAAEGLDFAIRFGDGAWHGTWAQAILAAPLSPLCPPDVAARLTGPESLLGQTLLRSYRADEWPRWFAVAGLGDDPRLPAGITFDSSLAMVEAALGGAGVALAPPALFERHLRSGALVQPFEIGVDLGNYWLTRLLSRPETAAMTAFRMWADAVAARAPPSAAPTFSLEVEPLSP